jgi:hypothetical protein
VILMPACVSVDFSGGGGKAVEKLAVLRGVVTSVNGDPLEDVEVEAGKASDATTGKGRYELEVTASEKQVRFALDGYVNGFRSPALDKDIPTQLDVILLPRAESVPLDAAEGGIAAVQPGASVHVPADAFVDDSGKAVTGTVDVYVSPFDPSDANARAAAPELVTEVGGERQLLESLGMVDIRVRQDDEALDLESGKALELSIPLPDDSEPEAAIGFWSFDESKSLWVKAGKAKFDAGTNAYVGSAEHVGLWSVGQLISATCICGLAEQSGAGALARTRIEARGVSYFGSSSAQSGGDGRFCVAVGKDSDIEVVAYDASNGVESKQVRSKSAETSVPPRASDARCTDVGTWRVAKD